MQYREIFIRATQFSFTKFVLRVEEAKEQMYNLIVFETVPGSNREFLSERVKNKENFTGAVERSSWEDFNFSYWKIRPHAWRRKVEDVEFNSLSNCHRFK